MPTSTTSAEQAARVDSLAREAFRALQINDLPQAARCWQQVLAIDASHPQALTQLGQLHLMRGEPDAARPLLERAVAAKPDHAIAHAYLARVHQAGGDADAALTSLDRAIGHEPSAWGARFEKASLLEALGRHREAALCWGAALPYLPDQALDAPHLRPVVERARKAVELDRARLREHLNARTASVREGERPRNLERFDHCLAITTGQRAFVTARPLMVPVPALPAIPFFHREDFDWAANVEAATSDIQAELEQVLRTDAPGFRPYVQTGSGEDPGQFASLDNSMAWGAYFLWRHGQRIDAHCKRCPKTIAAVEQAPLIHVRGRAPAVLFSVLEPGTHIPPHNGATNARLTVHLPLIVPPGCGFRVGDEMREWRPGELFIFDDTIRHEAWNHGTSRRVVLIFDVWHPMLSALERELITRTIEGMIDYYNGASELGEL